MQRHGPVVLGKQQVAKQRAGPACEPLVDADHRPVALLDLLLLQRERGGEGCVEVFF